MSKGWERSECYVRDRDGPLALAVACGLMLIIVVVLTVVSALLALVAFGLLGMLVYRRARRGVMMLAVVLVRLRVWLLLHHDGAVSGVATPRVPLTSKDKLLPPTTSHFSRQRSKSIASRSAAVGGERFRNVRFGESISLRFGLMLSRGAG
jgi:hypothetical protein